MDVLRLRRMTTAEFEAFRSRAVRDYAAARVHAGDWNLDRAEELAAEQTTALLPRGADTPGMLLLTAETEQDEIVGSAWVSLHYGENRGAWIYAFEIEPSRRGKGYGRAVLHAVEQLVRQHGIDTIGLDVFPDNQVARKLYESSGYETTSLHMRKGLK
jgi:ribosomal protein S18 acetylase RimI-like enzyme